MYQLDEKLLSPALYLASSLPLVEGRAGRAWDLQRNIFSVPSVLNLVPVTTSHRYLHVFLLSFIHSFSSASSSQSSKGYRPNCNEYVL